MNLLQKDKTFVWHSFSSLQEKYPPLLVKSAKGCKLTLDDGTGIKDAVSSWWTNIHGHSLTANAITCALSNQSIEMLLKPEMNKARLFINDSHKDILTYKESSKNKNC